MRTSRFCDTCGEYLAECECPVELVNLPSGVPELNQCDGCARHMPVDSCGIHYDPSSGTDYYYMVCTADLYTPKESKLRTK